MKAGRSIIELATELQRQQESKRDFVADTRKLNMIPAVKQELEDGSSIMEALLEINDTNLHEEYAINGNAHSQIASRLNIPKRYYDKMLDDSPRLLADNVNHWLHNHPEQRMIRTMDGSARAFLSNRYRCLDNFDLAQNILPIFAEAGDDMKVVSCDVTPNKLYIKALFPKIEGEIGLGDQVQSGVVISNSEIGSGSLRVEPLLFRLVCLNGMIANTSMKKYHVGKQTGNDLEEAFEIYADKTIKADDTAFWLKVVDTVRASLSQSAFDDLIIKAREAGEKKIDVSPIQVIERAKRVFSLTENEGNGILEHLIRGEDMSMWGLCNAVTRTSQDVPDYDRATELERLGGRIIELPVSEYHELAVAA